MTLDLYDTALVQLDRAENQVEDLKFQLDDAAGAEDLLEQLGDKNLFLTEVSRVCMSGGITAVTTDSGVCHGNLETGRVAGCGRRPRGDSRFE